MRSPRPASRTSSGGRVGCRATRGDAARVLAAGLLIVVGYHLFLNIGEQHTTSGIAAFVVALAPGMTLFAFALGLDRLVMRLVGLAVAFAGVAIVVGLGSGSDLSSRAQKARSSLSARRSRSPSTT